jgi:hypothetical protein
MDNKVTYAMPETTANYIFRLLKAADSSSEVKELIHAAHHILAGGSVKVEIVKSGDPGVVSELATIQAEANRHSNEINKNAGTYLTAVA